MEAETMFGRKGKKSRPAAMDHVGVGVRQAAARIDEARRVNQILEDANRVLERKMREYEQGHGGGK